MQTKISVPPTVGEDFKEQAQRLGITYGTFMSHLLCLLKGGEEERQARAKLELAQAQYDACQRVKMSYICKAEEGANAA